MDKAKISKAIVAKRPKPVVLLVLDGWGISQPFPGNAIAQAGLETMNRLIADYPSTTLAAAGDSVGLPWGEEGNSEVGHLNLGLGRILYQDLPRINKSISERAFYRNETLVKAVNHAKQNGSKLHFIGLVSDGCVHSSIDHLFALMDFAKDFGLNSFYIHAILDGRDTAHNAGLNFIKSLKRRIKKIGSGEIATVSGRFYAMDRNNNWDRTAKTYAALVAGAGNFAKDAVLAIEQSYGKKIYDEEFVPAVILKEDNKPVAVISDNDAVVIFNFRPDRVRQLARAFVLRDFANFKRGKFLKNLYFATFTEYEKGLPAEVVFPPETISNALGEIISRVGLKQLRIAETEKYAHVTYFFNGGREEKSAGEDHILVPSPAVASYDAKPEMSAYEVTDKLVEAVLDDKYDFILVNFANADMVGHTGNLEATVKALQAVDACLERIVKNVLAKNGVVLITADHGNAESIFNMQTGQIDKEHSNNPVPFIIAGRQYLGKTFGWHDSPAVDLSLVKPQGILSDVAPTILKIMGLKKPKEMTGISLV